MKRFNSLFKTLILVAISTLMGHGVYAQFPAFHNVAAPGGNTPDPASATISVDGNGGTYQDDNDPVNYPGGFDGSDTLVFQPSCPDFNVLVNFTTVAFTNADLGDYLLYSTDNFATSDTINFNDNASTPIAITGNQAGANAGRVWFIFVSNGANNNAQGWFADVSLDNSSACANPAIALNNKISISETSGTFGNPITACVNSVNDSVQLDFSFVANMLYQCVGLTQDIDSVDVDFGNGALAPRTGLVLADVDAADPNVYTSATQSANYGVGTYTITATLYDNYGCSATVSRNITIYGPNFTNANVDYEICQGSPVTLSQSHTNNAGETTTSVTWVGPKLTSAPTALDSTWKTGGNTLPIFPGKLKLNGATQETFLFEHRVVTTGTGACTYTSALSVTIYAQPDAGVYMNPVTSDGTPFLICADQTSLELNNLITPNPTTLSFTNVYWNPSAANPGTAPFNDADALPSDINPAALNASGGAGLYRYFLVTENGVCPADSTAATVNVVREPYPGFNDGTVIRLCEANTAFALKDSLDEAGIAPDAGGVWYINGGTIPVGPDTISSDFLDASKLAPGNYAFTYEVENPTCGPRSADLFITILDNPTVSRDTTFDVCSDESLILLYDFLDRSASDPGNDTDRDFTDVSVSEGSGVASNTFAASPGFFDPQNENLEGTYVFKYVAEDNVPPCFKDSITITINFFFAPEAGVDNSADVCGSDAAYDLSGLIGPTASSVTGRYFDITNGTPLAGSTVDLTVLTDGSYDYYYIVDAKGNCDGDTALFTLNVTEFFSPGADLTVTICETDAPFTIFDVLSPDAELGGSFSGDATGNDATTYDPAGQGGQTYTINYTQGANGFCADTTAVLTLVVGKEVMAGNDAAIDTCAIPNIILSDYVSADNGFSGPADPTITWSFVSPDGVPISDAANTGSADFTGLLGTFDIFYIVSSPSCIDTAVISITTYKPPYAGEDDFIVACTDDAPLNPFNLRLAADGADIDGVWTDVGGIGGLVDPTVYNTDFDAANSTQTTNEGDTLLYVVEAPFCPNDTAKITAFISELPSAGVSDTAFTCESETDFDLFETLTGDYTTGGFWTLKDIAVGSFTPTEIATIKGQVNNYLNEYIKDGASPKDKSVLDVDSLVTFIRNFDASKECEIFKSTFIFEYSAEDTSAFVYNGTPIAPPCTNTINTGNLVISKDWSYLRDPGEVVYNNNGAPIDICQDENAYDMFNGFYQTNPYVKCSNLDTLLYESAPITPAVDGTRTFTAGAVTFAPDQKVKSFVITQTILTAGCDAVELPRRVTLNVNKLPNSGIANTLALCATETAYVLDSALLGEPDAGGTWLNVGPALPPGAQSGARGQFFDASKVNAANSPFSFEYSVTSAACGKTATTTVSIDVVDEPILGADVNVTLCSELGCTPYQDGPFFSNPNFDLTGTFTSTSIGFSGTDINDACFNPSVAYPTETNAVVTYTVVSPACGTYTRQFNYTLVPRDTAGADNTVEVCETTANVNLTTLLVSPSRNNGTFFDAGGNAVTPPNFKPIANGPGTYVFTYRVNDNNGCGVDEATITIVVNQQYDPGTDGTITICETRQSVDLLNEVLTGSPDVVTGATSSDFEAAAPVLNGALSGTVDEVLDINTLRGLVTIPGTFDFNYTVPANGACPQSEAVATVIIERSPRSGKAAVNDVDVCSNVTSYDLTAALGVAGTDYDNGGVWRNSNGITTAEIINPNTLPAGVNTYTYTVSGNGVCKDTTSVVNVNIIAKPRAGRDSTVTICSDQTQINLFNVINSFEGGGIWADIDGFGGLVPTSGNVNLGLTSASTLNYYYIVSRMGCVSDTSIATVIITEKPNPGPDTLVTVCNTLASYNLFNALGDAGTDYTAGGLWTDAASGSAVNPIDPRTYPLGPKNFIYTLDAVGGCKGTYSSRVTVNIVNPPSAGNALDTTLCSSLGTINLFDYLDANASGGTWTPSDGTGFDGVNSVDISTLAGTYTYDYEVTRGGCNDIETLTITVITKPNAGADVNGVACVNADADLLLFLDPAADLTGVFTAITPGVNDANALNGTIFNTNAVGQGVYSFRYRVDAGGCIGDESIVKITVVEAGNDTTIVTCIAGDTINLNDLSGNLSAANIWVDALNTPPTKALSGVNFIPTRLLNTGKFTFELSDAPGTQTGCVTQVNIEVVDTLTIEQTVDCDLVFEEYRLILDIEGGMTNADDEYTIDGLDGNQVSSATGKRFTSVSYDFGQEITFTVSDSTGACNLNTIVATTDCDIVAIVPEGFSPNGDGKNDFLVIDQINQFPNNRLTVYNRWGGIVFESAGYSNDWDGTYQENGGDLPTGTYFYVFDTGIDGKKPIKGYVYISR